MTIYSTGYAGSIGWAAWAQMSASLGTDYGVVGTDEIPADAALALTVLNPTTGSVSVGPGIAHGRGIVDVLDAEEVVGGLTTPDTWYTVCVRRDWTPGPGSELSTVVALAGGSTRAITPSRVEGPGVTDDQPLWLVHRGATGLDDVVDLRCWWGNGGLSAGSLDALAYLGRAGSRVRVGAVTYVRAPGSGAWAPETVAASQVVSGALHPDRIPALPASRVTTEAFHPDRIPALPASRVTSEMFHPDRIPTLDIATKTSGALAIARGGTGADTAVGARGNLGAAAAWPGYAGRFVAARRTVAGDFAAGGFVSIMGANLPGLAGLWQITWTALISSSVPTIAQLRGTVDGQVLTGDQTWGIETRPSPLTLVTYYASTGPARALLMQVQLAQGLGNAPVGSRIDAVWQGPL